MKNVDLSKIDLLANKCMELSCNFTKTISLCLNFNMLYRFIAVPLFQVALECKIIPRFFP
jgi:hypothetical protein